MRLAQALGGLLAIVGLSCGNAEITYTIDSAFTFAQAQEIHSAAEAWNERTMAKLVDVSDVTGRDLGEWYILPSTPPGGWQGYSMGKRKLVRLDPTMPVYPTALHELGHVLGLKHVARGVMDPARQTVVFSWEDTLECERVEACQVP